MRKSGDMIGSVFFILAGVGAAISGIGFGIGDFTEPQPGFFPFVGGVALIGVAGVLFFQAWWGLSTGTGTLGKLWGPATVISAMACYAAALDSLGYILCTAMLSAIILWVLDTRSLRVLVVASLILSVGSYLLFRRLLDVPLPMGILAKLW